VYIGSLDGFVYCLDAITGKFVWNYTIGSIVGSSPAVAGGKVYVGSHDIYSVGRVYCLNADTGALIWSYSTGRGVYSLLRLHMEKSMWARMMVWCTVLVHFASATLMPFSHSTV
jgi:outer membrane protein assembly factor BamB